MSQHDTWGVLSDDPQYAEIKIYFPDGTVPLRDPFPMAWGEGDGEPLFVVDISRMTPAQCGAWALDIAIKSGAAPLEVTEEARRKGGFAIREKVNDPYWNIPF